MYTHESVQYKLLLLYFFFSEKCQYSKVSKCVASLPRIVIDCLVFVLVLLVRLASLVSFDSLTVYEINQLLNENKIE